MLKNVKNHIGRYNALYCVFAFGNDNILVNSKNRL